MEYVFPTVIIYFLKCSILKKKNFVSSMGSWDAGRGCLYLCHRSKAQGGAFINHLQCQKKKKKKSSILNKNQSNFDYTL